MRRQGTVAPKKEYSGERKGKMTPRDYGKAKEYGDKAKQKYIDRKKRKKKVTTCQHSTVYQPDP